MAIGIPSFLVLLVVFPTIGLGAGLSVVLALVLSVIVTETLERVVMTTPSRRRHVALFGIGVLLVWALVLPIWLVVESGA